GADTHQFWLLEMDRRRLAAHAFCDGDHVASAAPARLLARPTALPLAAAGLGHGRVEPATLDAPCRAPPCPLAGALRRPAHPDGRQLRPAAPLVGARRRLEGKKGVSSALWVALAFFSGALPFSVWIGALALGQDIQEVGDGNPGSWNVMRA